MKKVIAWLLVLALTAAVSIGATLAYLTDTDEDVNVMTLGKVKIDQLEYERIDTETTDEEAKVQEFRDNKPLYPAITGNGFDYTPGDTYVNWDQIGKDGYTSEIWNPANINNEVDKMVFVKNKGDYDAYVRSVIAFEAGKYTTLDEFNAKVHLNLNDSDWDWEWVSTPVSIPNADGTDSTNYFVAVATYKDALKPGALTEISLSQIALDKTATNEDVETFGDTYQVLVKSQAIQADGFTDAKSALKEGFGVITDANIPWENDSPTKGVNLKKALHYYEGGATKITGSVANVIFGKMEDYPEIANSDHGTLVDVEQDTPAYAYYVSNGSTYDVYVLSDGTIYAPADSKGLCANMTSLKTVEGPLDTSRVVDMESMFDYCAALQSVDSTDWDTSNVTDMKFMFYGCKALTDVDVSGWDLGNVTNMNSMFWTCSKLETLDVSDWNVSNVTAMNQTFFTCTKLKTLDVADWDVGKVEDFYYTFTYCGDLDGLDVSKWDTSSAKTMSRMFRDAKSISALDVSNWDTSNVTDMCQVFMNLTKPTVLDVTNWDTSKVVDMRNMFWNCDGITSLDLSKWNISNVKNFEGTFGEMSNMTQINMTGWTPTSAETMYSMFYYCTGLTSIDVSGWQLPNLRTSSHMFRSCTHANPIDVSGWYTPSLTSMDAMFHTCYAVTELDVSSFDTSKCQEISQVFEACTSLHTIHGLNNWDTSSAGTFEECFSGASALKVLDLSSFSSQSVVPAHPMQNNATGWGFRLMLNGMSSLEKLIMSENFSFTNEGTVTNYPAVLPSPMKKAGFTAKWRNVETGELYDASEIPEKTAATYEAYYEAIP